MNDMVIGPFRIDFTRDGVIFHTADAADTHTLTYGECYQLWAVLYQRRDALYQLSHRDDQREGPPTYVYNDVTYVINDDSIAVAGWERTKEEDRRQENEEPPA